MGRPSSVARFGDATTAIQMQPTPMARRLSVLRLRGQGAVDSDDGSGVGNANGRGAWPEDLPPLRWVQQLGPLKPATEVLASSQRSVAGGGPLPLVTRMRYGAGQSVYVATDEIWRWRYGRGELYYQQFWIQLLRMLGRGRVQQMAGPAQLDTAHRQIDLGDTTVVTLRLNDPAIADQGLSSIAVEVAPADEASGEPIDTLTLRPRESSGQSGNQTELAGRVYEATWQPNASGQLLLNVTQPALANYELTETLDVAAPGDEQAHPRTDHPRLVELARATEGQVVSLDNLARLKTAVPNLAEATANDVTEPIWHSPLALILALLLLTCEWVGRKLIRLV